MKASGLMVLISVCALGGCSAFGRYAQMQDNISKFDQGAHMVSVSEISFLHQVQSGECSRNFYEQAFQFATAQQDPTTHRYPKVALDLQPACTPQELTNQEMQVRQQLMDAITLYADTLLALAGGSNDTSLDSSSEALAKGVQSLAAQQKFTAIGTNDVAGVNAAISTLAGFLIDHREYGKITTAASKLQQPLTTIVSALKSENLNNAQGLASKQQDVTNDFRAAVSASRDHSGAASFLDIAQARTALNSILISPQNVSQLNAALDALLAANQSLGSPPSGASKAEISALISRGQQAVAVFNSSK